MIVKDVRIESWPLAKPFTISRGTKTSADVVVVELSDNKGNTGRAECVPYPRYGESVLGVHAFINTYARSFDDHTTNELLNNEVPAGAGRNALDCALWDLRAKQSEERVWHIANTPEPQAIVTAETISLGDVEQMAAAATALKAAPLLKVKLNRDQIVTRIAAIRDAAPSARMIIDPNESWTIDILKSVARPLKDLGVEMIEQPLPADEDHVLSDFKSPVALCADESCHTAETLADLKSRYSMINIKLDKTGGLTEALGLARAAESLAFGIMIGCMVGTSLAMAPATVLAPWARFVDLDGPLLLKEDRSPGLNFQSGLVSPPSPALWG